MLHLCLLLFVGTFLSSADETSCSDAYECGYHDINIEENAENDEFKTIDPNKTEEEFRNYEDSQRQEVVSKFYQDQHEKMTFDFVKKQREKYLKFDKITMSVWDMLLYLDTVVDESDPDTDLTQLEHAIQTGEEARRQYPDEEYDWFHVTAFVHDLGKILAVTDEEKGLEGDPQWCVVGDNFPVGCKFRDSNVFSEFFKENEDYNNPKYNTTYGIYSKNIGLSNIMMSWGHDEYFYHICKTQSKLPPNALYIIRYHSFYPWHNKNDYRDLMDLEGKDEEALKWVRKFQKCDLYSKSHNCPTLKDVESYYREKIDKYFPNDINW